jgi:murein L,D-transpeptidase YcbB/YkuD
MIRRSSPIFILAAWMFTAAALAADPPDPVVQALADRLEEMQAAGSVQVQGAVIGGRVLLPAIYAGRDYHPLWTDPARVREFLDLVATAPDDGLRLEDYLFDELRAQLAAAEATKSPLDRANLDLLLTESVVRYGYHQLFGKVDATELDGDVNFARRFFADREPAEAIPAFVESPVPLRAQLEQFVHRSPVYRGLKRALADHRRIAADGGWPVVPAGETLHPGDEDPRVAMLRQRLVVTGDLPPGSDLASPYFDDALKTAVIRFQGRHGLDADGVVGKNSYAAMNVPVERRIDQIRLSLERLRWVRLERSERFIAVNIAGFRVFFVNGDGIDWISRAIIGKPYRQTPVFRGTLSYLEINPTWTVPPTILRQDKLPAIKRDPGYLAANNISVLDRNGRRIDPSTIDWQSYGNSIPYTLRQEPGRNNALGEIKFIFPNKHFVFLHDTPSRSLFARAERTFSSGCIRVEDPFRLAELIMDDPIEYNRAALEAIRDTRQTRRIDTPKLPVLVLYLTASLEPDGRVRLLNDVYGRDSRLLEALNGPVVISELDG